VPSYRPLEARLRIDLEELPRVVLEDELLVRLGEPVETLDIRRNVVEVAPVRRIGGRAGARTLVSNQRLRIRSLKRLPPRAATRAEGASNRPS
jgi:hypothetical protein